MSDVDRPGMFMDAIRRRLPPPPAARTLGFELVEVEPDAGTIVAAFDAGQAFTNPFGEVLGGFIAAMLYDTVGPAVLATLAPGEFIETHELRTTFIRPASVGRLIGHGRIVRRDGDRAIVQASLADVTGNVVATAEATIEVVRRDGPRGPA
jgi:uncharacterized protein (TIGR00369 family)